MSNFGKIHHLDKEQAGSAAKYGIHVIA